MHAALRVLVVATVVASTLPSSAAGQATAKLILRPDEGYSLAVPPGWAAVADPAGGAAIARTDNRQVKATVLISREPRPTIVTETLARALAVIHSTKGQTVVSSTFDVYLERPALFAVYEDATTRYRTILVPREYEEHSQVYYRLTIAAPKTAFAKLTAAFDRMFTGFAILEGTARTAAVAGPTRPIEALAPAGFDRDAAIERMLSPLKRPGG